jgi:chromosome segregation ATPase
LKEKIQENLRLKEELIAAAAKLKVAEQSLALQQAEFAFQRSEYEAELQSVRGSDADLRDEVQRLAKEKTECLHDAERAFRGQLDEALREQQDYVQTLQVQVMHLRSQAVELQAAHETLKDDFHHLQHENQVLQSRLADDQEMAVAKVTSLERRLAAEQQAAAQALEESRNAFQESEKVRASLQCQMHSAEIAMTDLKTNLAIVTDREAMLKKHPKELTNSQTALFAQLAEERERNGQLLAINSQLNIRVDLLQSELKSTRRIIAQIQDNTKHMQMVCFCSPLQRTRIDFLKTIALLYHELTNALFRTGVHCKMPSLLRSVFLAVLFMLRWKENTGNQTEICNHSGALGVFDARPDISPIKVMADLRYQLSALRSNEIDFERRVGLAEATVSEMTTTKAQEHRQLEAAQLKLRSMKKCHQMLHRQFGSFIEFHNALVDPELRPDR